ncbi:MAG: hypothetical protein KAS62_10110, partial [Candidatus Delongbacteria bacterium]|nr:hypothetical protein [Candidatus Delongbacteria bacterium]
EWNVGDELVVGLIDSMYAKTRYSVRITWEIDDDSSDYAGIGMEPLLAGTGLPIAIYPWDYPGWESPPGITAENDSLTISWDNYSDLMFRNIYSSDEPYNGFELEEYRYDGFDYTVPISSSKKFYRIYVDFFIPPKKEK